MRSGAASQTATYVPRRPTPWHASHMGAPCNQKSPRKSALSIAGGVVNALITHAKEGGESKKYIYIYKQDIKVENIYCHWGNWC